MQASPHMCTVEWDLYMPTISGKDELTQYGKVRKKNVLVTRHECLMSQEIVLHFTDCKQPHEIQIWILNSSKLKIPANSDRPKLLVKFQENSRTKFGKPNMIAIALERSQTP